MKYLIIVFLSLVSTAVLAQGSPSKIDSAGRNVDFLTQVKLDLSEIASESSEGTSLFFNKAWQDNTFSAAHKKQIEKQYVSMKNNGYMLQSHRFPYISALAGAAANLNLPEAAITSFLETTEQALDKLDARQLERFLVRSDNLLARKAIYYSKYYQLAFEKGTILFKWQDLQQEEVALLPQEIEKEEEVEKEQEESWGDGWESTDDSWESDDSGWGNDDSDWGSDDSWGTQSESNESNDSESATESALEQYKTPLPSLVGPTVEIKNTNLKFCNPIDTVKITDTSVSLELLAKTVNAENGSFSWEHLGLKKNEINAKFTEFTLEANQPKFTAEDVELSYPSVVKAAVKGILEYQAENRKKGRRNYPKFQSYKGGYDLNVIKKTGLSLTGGLSMRGKTFTSAALDQSEGQLFLQGVSAKKFMSKSQEFIFRDSTFYSNSGSISIYQQRDSVYHPGVRLKYEVNKDLLTLYTGEGGYKKTPYRASYFEMDFNADKIEWPLDSTYMDISIMLADNRIPATFESSEYFNEYRFNSLSGMYPFHPLQLVVHHSRQRRKKVFYVDELAEATKQKPSQLRASMQLLKENGFIGYDPISGQIKLLEKAFHYVDSKWKRKDYDNIQINSLISGQPNGRLDFQNNTLTLRGVEEFDVSKKLGVRVEPDSGIVVLEKNRSIKFDGTVFAGNYKYIGSEFNLDYDSFKIDLPTIDKIKFNLVNNERSNRSQQDQLENQLVESAGTLYINKPDNKSAVKEYPSYPIFNATSGATVYFLGEEILGGVYDQALYFEIPPFSIDSVSSTDPNSIAFDGTFHSGGIFPEFEEKLKVMPDKSLGFEHTIPEEGIDLLEGEAKFFGDLRLDNKGLRGGDRIEYLSSTVMSDNFTFFKDSITASVNSIEMMPGDVQGSSYPQLSATNLDMRWLTLKDSLYLRNKGENFSMYNETATFDGEIAVSKKGLFADGKLLTRGSQTTSDKFSFKEFNVSARNADFIIESNDSVPALASEDVKLSFDLDRNVASINPEVEGDAALNFLSSQYKTSIPNATWRLDEEKVIMEKPAGSDIRTSYFYSTDPKQDSLVYNATGAVYDIADQSLIISGVPSITVADAKISPADGSVVIGENNLVNKLFNASMKIDTLTEYHDIYQAEVQIFSRNKFEGTGIYSYVNTLGDTFSIDLDQFVLEPIPNPENKEKTLRTVSSGKIRPEERFLISPGMYYKGNVTMYADKPALKLDGYVQLDLKDIPNYDTWIKYESDGSNKEVVFNFDEAETEMGEPLQAGIHFDGMSGDLYATFLNEKRDFSDEDFFRPSGELKYKQSSKSFVIEDLDKAIGNSYAGKFYAYNEEDQRIKFEGPLKFLDSSDEAKFLSAGSGQGSIIDQKFDFNVLLSMEFDLPSSFIPIIGNDAMEVVQRLGLPEANSEMSELLPKVAEVAGNKAAKAYEEAIFKEYVPLHAIARELQKTVTLSNIDLKWSAENTAWYSVGKVGLSNFGANDINASIDAFVEIRRQEGMKILKMLLQVSPSCWYYFHYEGDQLIIFTANKEANELIDKKSKAEKAKFGEFVFIKGDKDEAVKFVEDYRKKYYQIDAPYYLEMAEEASASAAPTQMPVQQEQQPASDDDDGF